MLTFINYYATNFQPLMCFSTMRYVQNDIRLIEEAQDFSSSLPSTSLIVIHNSECSCEHDVSKVTSREDVLNPLLNILKFDMVWVCTLRDEHTFHKELMTYRNGDIKARRKYSALVNATNQFDNNFS